MRYISGQGSNSSLVGDLASAHIGPALFGMAGPNRRPEDLPESIDRELQIPLYAGNPGMSERP